MQMATMNKNISAEIHRPRSSIHYITKIQEKWSEEMNKNRLDHPLFRKETKNLLGIIAKTVDKILCISVLQ
jgi:hypothetical protein